MQGKECTCASIELANRRVSSRMITTDKINRGLKIRRGKNLGLFTRSSLIATLMRAGFFVTVIPICASAQTRKQITATQAQIAAQQAQKNADLAISQLDPQQAQLDAISQADALQVGDETPAVRDSLQNQAKTGEAAAAPGASAALATRDLTVPPAAAPSPTPSPAETPAETTPAPEGGHDAAPRAAVLPALPVSTPPAPDGEKATPDKIPEGGGDRLQGAPGARRRRAQHDEASAVTPAAPRPKALGRHEHRLRQPARPQPQSTFWQRLFGQKEPKTAKPGKPRQ
jgi:hypothetical protein